VRPGASAASGLSFELPSALEAVAPPPRRDAVRLLVAHRDDGRIEHRRFSDLPALLRPGDLLVVNVSATLPAAVAADGARIHFSTRVPGRDHSWRVVEVRSEDGSRPRRARAGERIKLRGGATLELVAPYLGGGRLMLGRLDPPGPVEDYLRLHGEPIHYGYVPERWPLREYQNVYATTPGSAEMPSAGRPFTRRLIAQLAAAGVVMGKITLHAGVSSPERHELPFPEQFEVPEVTARQIGRARGRVIAVGTTVVRALETTGGEAGSGWTNLVIGPERGVRVVDGLITGWHEPEASHLQMLEAIAGRELLRRSYEHALAGGYRWHEFGDSHLIL
jgi:S-adenosylmethionine:tRNA ribosyltransferase-isomerase